MDNINIFLIINSALVAILGISLGVVGFFLKDLHKEFKTLLVHVNQLSSGLLSHTKVYDQLSTFQDERIKLLNKRIEEIEHRIRKPPYA